MINLSALPPNLTILSTLKFPNKSPFGLGDARIEPILPQRPSILICSTVQLSPDQLLCGGSRRRLRLAIPVNLGTIRAVRCGG